MAAASVRTGCRTTKLSTALLIARALHLLQDMRQARPTSLSLCSCDNQETDRLLAGNASDVAFRSKPYLEEGSDPPLGLVEVHSGESGELHRASELQTEPVHMTLHPKRGVPKLRKSEMIDEGILRLGRGAAGRRLRSKNDVISKRTDSHSRRRRSSKCTTDGPAPMPFLLAHHGLRRCFDHGSFGRVDKATR